MYEVFQERPEGALPVRVCKVAALQAASARPDIPRPPADFLPGLKSLAPLALLRGRPLCSVCADEPLRCHTYSVRRSNVPPYCIPFLLLTALLPHVAVVAPSRPMR